MGGTTEPITTALKESYAENADLRAGHAHRREGAAGR